MGSWGGEDSRQGGGWWTQRGGGLWSWVGKAAAGGQGSSWWTGQQDCATQGSMQGNKASNH